VRAGPLAAGDPVLLVDRKRRSYLIWLREDGVYDLRGGRIPHSVLIGQPEGTTIETSRGERLLVLRPTLADYVLAMPRGAQVVYPKDLGLMLMLGDIYPGATVIEAGTGSGALTMALVRAVGLAGRVYSYEVRQEFQQTGARNIARYLGETPNLVLRLHDITTGIPDAPADRIVLDLPEPWRVVAPALEALRPGGIFVAYVPTTVQVQQTTSTLRASGGFAVVEIVESLLRPWNVEGQSVRPVHRMVAHTGFVITARRIVGGAPMGVAVEPPAAARQSEEG
jgi:tRNA (adenine57-N1/adenine58-N1)-methyltransferase